MIVGGDCDGSEGEMIKVGDLCPKCRMFGHSSECFLTACYSDDVRAAVREALLAAQEYEGDLEHDLLLVIDELRNDAAAHDGLGDEEEAPSGKDGEQDDPA